MKKILALSALVVLFVLAVFGQTLATSDAGFNIESSYKIAVDGTNIVSHRLNAKNTTAAKTPAVLKIPIAGTEPSSISAKVDDKDAPATISQDGSTIDVKLPDLTGKDKTWKLSLSYKSKILSELGKVKAIQIPALSRTGLAITSQKTVVAADLEIGLAVALPAPTKTDIAVGEQIFTYENKTGPVGDAVTLVFGDDTAVLVDIASELKNSGWWWKTVELTLPPDTNQQQVLLSSLEPKPSNVRLDQDGNILAQYKLGPKKSINVTAKAMVNVKNLSYSLDSKKTLNDIEQSLKDLYTEATDKWLGGQLEVDVNPVSSVSEIAKTIYDAVVAKARTDAALDSNQDLRNTAIDSLGKYADMLIGELRANGVPARAVLGKIASDGQFILGGGISHTWVEAYIPDTGWVTMDPALAAYGDYFGSSEVLHIGLALWGVSDDSPPIDLAQVSVDYIADDFEIPEATPVLSAVKTVIFPGISIMKVNVETPPGIITDGNALEYGGQIYQLGSLAPLQIAESKSLRYGASSINSEDVSYGYSDGLVMTTEVAKTQSTTSYTVLIIEAILLVIGVGLFVFFRKRRAADKYKPSKDSLIMHDEDAGGEVESIDMVGSKPLKIEPQIVQPTQQAENPTIAPVNEPTKPPTTRDTINSSGNGNSFQKPSDQNPRRHIVQ